MAEPLKNQFGTEIPGKIAWMIARVYPTFDQDAFIRDALDGYEALDLVPRGWKIARTLRGYLPGDYPEAAEILIQSLGPKLDKTEGNGDGALSLSPARLFCCRVWTRPLRSFDARAI